MKKIITDFSYGEISTKFDGRADLPYYTKGCSELRNMYVMPQGVAGRIGGTEVLPKSNKSILGGEDAILIPLYYSENDKLLIRMTRDEDSVYTEWDAFDINTNEEINDGQFAWGKGLDDVQWVQVNESSTASLILTHPSARPKLLKYNPVTKVVTINDLTVTAGVGEETFSTSGHYPSVCGYFAGRLIFGATATNPDMLWMSKTLNPTNFTLGNNDGDAIALHITTSDYNKILWVEPKDEGIVVGTTTTETMITGGDNGLTPTSLQQTKISSYGSSHTDPVQIGLSTVFVEGGERVLRELAYTDQNGALYSPDLTMLADHLTESGIKRMAYQLEPFEAIFCLRNDGKVALLTYDRNTGMNAWSLLDLGCKVLDICTLDNVVYFLTYRFGGAWIEKLKPYEDNDHYLWSEMTIYRTLWGSGSSSLYWDGDTLTYGDPFQTLPMTTGDKITATTYQNYKYGDVIGTYTVEMIDEHSVKLIDEDGEYVTSPLTDNSYIGVFLYSDTFSYNSYNQPSPFKYGEKVSIFDADGKYLGKFTINDIYLTLPEKTWKITVGYYFTSHMRTMRLMQDAIGNPVGRINKVYLRLWKSLGCKIGQTMDDGEEITFRDGELDLGTPALYTGDKEHVMLTEYTTQGHFYVWTDDIHPLYISAMAVDYRAGGQRR